MSAVRYVLVAVMATAGTLGACADDDTAGTADRGEPVSTTTTVPTFTLEQLAAAMPTEADLPDGYGITDSCLTPEDPDCLQDTLYPYVSVAADNSGGSSIDEFFAVTATMPPNADAAADQQASSRTEAGREDGAFDFPVEESEDGSYTPGRRGEGRLEDAEIDGWTGYRLVSSYESTHPDGTTDPPAMDGTLVLTKGNVVLTVQVDMHAGETPDDTPEARLDTWMRSVITKLA